MRSPNFIPLAILALLMAIGSRTEAQMTTLTFDGKAALVGEIVNVPESGRIADAKMMMKGQDIIRVKDEIMTVTAGVLMAVTEAEIRFPAIQGLDVGEVAVELGPETVICLADGTISKDWLAVGQNAVAIVPQNGGPAISVRNALWMFEDLMMIPRRIDPSCSNADYPVLVE